ncbi:hypothetical protein ASC59_16495 [Leifsonia sp. Root1293]|nr:hypothetical protein ASC59_16495 [Leifsonia sp. Root1293]KRA09306.1 hypothetical protein ASD61_16490 [Leifsonia sp. Root60]
MVASVGVLLVAAVAWVGIRGWMAKSELESAQAKISTLKTQALAFDVEKAERTVNEISDSTAAAASLTSDPVWRAMEVVPLAGPNLHAVRQLASVTNLVMTDVAGPLVGVLGTINPSTVLPAGSALDPQPFVDATPAVERAASSMERAQSRMSQIDTASAIPQVAAIATSLRNRLSDIAAPIKSLGSVIPLVPQLLGADGTRTYAVVFQNNAESRALGGTALSFAVLKVDAGRIVIDSIVPAGFDNFPKSASSIVPIPDGAEAVYPDGIYGTFIANATLRPDFTSAAEIIQANFTQARGTPLDGVISVDPMALSYILRASAPMTISTGDVIDSKTLVPFILNTVYARYDSGDVVEDNIMQDAVYGEVVQAAFSRLMDGSLEPEAAIAGIGRGLSEQRLMLWSAHEVEQSAFAALNVNGPLPKSDATTEKVGIYFQDAVGSKLNYYLRQSVTLESGACGTDQLSTYGVQVDLSSAVPANAEDLSASIIGQWERENLQPGEQRVITMLYAPPGSTITGITVDGQPQDLPSLHDTDYPVGKVTVAIPPGGVSSIRFTFTDGGSSPKELSAQVTPMVAATDVVSQAISCSPSS